MADIGSSEEQCVEDLTRQSCQLSSSEVTTYTISTVSIYVSKVGGECQIDVVITVTGLIYKAHSRFNFWSHLLAISHVHVHGGGGGGRGGGGCLYGRESHQCTASPHLKLAFQLLCMKVASNPGRTQATPSFSMFHTEKD